MLVKTEMQQIKKVINVGNSKGIAFPKPWLGFHRRKYGCELKEVLIDVQDMVITISPVLSSPERTS
jgi:hypothetical protein